jgi:hypothetical protein
MYQKIDLSILIPSKVHFVLRKQNAHMFLSDIRRQIRISCHSASTRSIGQTLQLLSKTHGFLRMSVSYSDSLRGNHSHDHTPSLQNHRQIPRAVMTL